MVSAHPEALSYNAVEQRKRHEIVGNVRCCITYSSASMF